MTELHKIASAFQFFTRIPIHISIPDWEKYINTCQRYFPLVGWVVGGICALSFYAASLLLPVELALIFSIVIGILLTGAFHEDGFGDICDGFGGGYTPERILEIMKDSRMGAYGVIGIVLMLFTKFTSLNNVPLTLIPIVIIAGHVLSRWFSLSLLLFMKYARIDETSKSKPVAKVISVTDFSIATIISFVVLFLFNDVYVFLALILPLVGTIWMAWYFQRKIGGYTGDCLGAIQQLSEVLFYIGILMVY